MAQSYTIDIHVYIRNVPAKPHTHTQYRLITRIHTEAFKTASFMYDYVKKKNSYNLNINFYNVIL